MCVRSSEGRNMPSMWHFVVKDRRQSSERKGEEGSAKEGRPDVGV